MELGNWVDEARKRFLPEAKGTLTCCHHVKNLGIAFLDSGPN